MNSSTSLVGKVKRLHFVEALKYESNTSARCRNRRRVFLGHTQVVQAGQTAVFGVDNGMQVRTNVNGTSILYRITSRRHNRGRIKVVLF